MKNILFLVITFFFTVSCKKEVIETGNEDYALEIPKGFPMPVFPDDNKPTQNRIDLGKRLFFDPILSRDSTISCASCHLQEKYFTDGLTHSVGIENRTGNRNSPTILNSAYLTSFFWDGGVPTLEQQALAPIANHVEMDFDVVKVVDRLNKISSYVTQFQNAYNQGPSTFTLTRAIANYERSLFTGISKFDKYRYYGNSSALNESEIRGMNIFMGERGECFHCHGGFNFSDNSFQNNGLYLIYADTGRARITQKSSDVGKFKVPSLRNIAFTAPYMHDGSIATLEDAVEHYNTGIQRHPNKSGLLFNLNLSTQEKEDLVNFLKALSDE